MTLTVMANHYHLLEEFDNFVEILIPHWSSTDKNYLYIFVSVFYT